MKLHGVTQISVSITMGVNISNKDQLKLMWLKLYRQTFKWQSLMVFFFFSFSSRNRSANTTLWKSHSGVLCSRFFLWLHHELTPRNIRERFSWSRRTTYLLLYFVPSLSSLSQTIIRDDLRRLLSEIKRQRWSNSIHRSSIHRSFDWTCEFRLLLFTSKRPHPRTVKRRLSIFPYRL